MAVEGLLERLHVSRWIEPASVIFAILVGIATWWRCSTISTDAPILSPFTIAGFVVANLLAGTLLLMLIGRRLARRRAADSALGGKAKLHVRLVALFSLSASIPVLLMVVFASFLFQNGVEFWFSDRARGMLENASALAQYSYTEERREVAEETVAMSKDVRTYLGAAKYNSPEFQYAFGDNALRRELSGGALIRMSPEGEIQTLVLINPNQLDFSEFVTVANIARLESGEGVVIRDQGERIETLVKVPDSTQMYVYSARLLNPVSLAQSVRAKEVVADYRSLISRSRALQIQFNLALVIVSLLIMAAIVWFALQLADRLVRPISELAGAAHRITEGDLSARVAEPVTDDELGQLATAFNRMTGRLEQQTSALVDANHTLDQRNAFMQAVLTGVSAGVVSLDRQGHIRLVNRFAGEFFDLGDGDAVGKKLRNISSVLDDFVQGDQARAILEVPVNAVVRTIAATREVGERGAVITFDDITSQLADQRRAAWADVARRIAHEIKNPLTPIQLAAERLHRRYADKVGEESDGTFSQLTDTIVRQVGDLRRMIDEFSSFARMPKPVFRDESLGDIIRQAIFLQEVAHPAITFQFNRNDPDVRMTCDHRQIGQALTNIIKNAAEAIETLDDPKRGGVVDVSVTEDDGRAVIRVKDNGIGIPDNRDDLFEPYVTTREKGTGLGLAIVQKIVQDHMGVMDMTPAPEGGTQVTMSFDLKALREAMPDEDPSQLPRK